MRWDRPEKAVDTTDQTIPVNKGDVCARNQGLAFNRNGPSIPHAVVVRVDPTGPQDLGCRKLRPKCGQHRSKCIPPVQKVHWICIDEIFSHSAVYVAPDLSLVAFIPGSAERQKAVCCIEHSNFFALARPMPQTNRDFSAQDRRAVLSWLLCGVRTVLSIGLGAQEVL